MIEHGPMKYTSSNAAHPAFRHSATVTPKGGNVRRHLVVERALGDQAGHDCTSLPRVHARIGRPHWSPNMVASPNGRRVTG